MGCGHWTGESGRVRARVGKEKERRRGRGGGLVMGNSQAKLVHELMSILYNNLLPSTKYDKSDKQKRGGAFHSFGVLVSGRHEIGFILDLFP